MRLSDIEGITDEEIERIKYLAILFKCQRMLLTNVEKYYNIESERIKK